MSQPNITLAEFNRIASGSQNAGQVDFKTNSDGEFTNELVKINNHVVFKSKNNVHLTGERVVAIKEAFLSALQKAHVSAEDLQTIRAELGMSGEIDASTDANEALLDKRYTPLTRDQIRTMLDKYADKGRGFEGGEGVATEREVRKADRTRNMSVVFSGGQAVQDMFDNNFEGKDKTALGFSAKKISGEIGGGFWELPGTTMNRLVKGAKVLGENDDKNTNVDNIPLPEEDDDDENKIELDV